ncbi:MAG: hypothetical protein IJR82_02180 [Bacilli bacterium]|nr:hypothetical protein [Bacilli bacterium]
MRKTMYLFVICSIFIFLGGYLFYDNFVKNEKCSLKNEYNIEKNNNQEVNKNKNYTELSERIIDFEQDHSGNLKHKRLDLAIKDNKLQAMLNYQEVNIKGLEGKIKSFIISRDYCSDVANKWLIAINDKNELYMTDINYYNRDDYMTFKKISLNNDIKDITDLDFNVGFSTCGRVNTAVVLKDNSVHQLKYDREKDTFTMSNTDVSNFKQSIGSTYIVYNDNTIGRFDTYGKYENEFNERLKYNNKELKASIIYESVENDYITYYIVSDNKLYKVENTYDGPQVTESKVSLVNDKRITVMMSKASSNVNYHDIDVTFEDDSTYIIKNISLEYNIN